MTSTDSTAPKKVPVLKLPPETKTEAGLIYEGGWTHEIAGDVYWHRKVVAHGRGIRRTRTTIQQLRYGWSGTLTVRRGSKKGWRTGEYEYTAVCELVKRNYSDGPVEATATYRVALPADKDAAQAACEAWAERVPEAFVPVVEARRAAAALERGINEQVTNESKDADA